MSWFRAASVCAFLVGLAAAPTTLASYVRQDTPSDDYLIGLLTWSNGKGGISWTGAAGAEGDGPAVTAANFVSDALPRALHLNSSRHIQLDVYKPGSSTFGYESCGIRTEIYAADRLLGGVAEHQQYSGYGLFPQDPPGYATCRLRIAPEIGILEKGTVLRVVVRFNAATSFGTAGDHGSVLRLPYFVEEELPFRYPSYAHGAPGSGPDAGQSVQGILTGAGFGGLTFAGWPRRQTRRDVSKAALIVVGLLGVAFGGCIGHPSSPHPAGGSNGDVAQATLSPVYQHGNLSAAGYGTLIGQVTASDVGQPLVGAYVALVGRTDSTRTDPYGRFVFKELPPGTYKVRIDRDGYRSFEGTVPVAANLVARVDVALDPLGDVSPGTRPHKHDYWENQTEIVRMKAVNLGVECPGAVQAYTGCYPTTAFMVPAAESGYSSILPGTYEVTLSLDWDKRSYAPNPMGILFQANNDRSLENWSELLPRPVGEAFHIAATWEMDDPGHQTFSTWIFQITNRSYGPNMYTQTVDWAKARDQPPSINVTLTIRKGVVPLEPVHPDPWAGASSLRVINHDRDPIFESPNTTPWTNAWFPTKTIPPAATWLLVTANRTTTPPVPYDVELRYRTAAEGPPTAQCWAYNREDNGASNEDACDGPEYIHLGKGTTTGNSTRWTIPLGGHDADPFYTRQSFWVFGLSRASDPVAEGSSYVDWAANYANVYGLHQGENTAYTMSVIAHRGAMPAP